MKIYSFFRLFIFLVAFSMVESTNSISDFNMSTHYDIMDWTNLSLNFTTNSTKSESLIFTEDVTGFLSVLEDQQNHSSNFSNRNLTILFIFSAVASLSVLINSRVFYIVFISSNRRSRPANVLVAHISFVVIVFTCVFYFYVLEKTNVLSLTGPTICNVFAFLRNNIFNVFPINAGSIIWMRTRSDAIILRKSFAYRLIGIMWTITIVGNIPSTFMVEFVKRSDSQLDKCKEIPLFGSFGATIAYESMRFVLFTVLVCLYLIRATIKIRSSIQYIRLLKLARTERMMKRMQQVKFVYLHTFVFILNWFPNGFILFLYKVFSRLGWTTDYAKFLTPFVFLNYSVFVLCPLSYVLLMEDVPTAKIFFPCFGKKQRTYFVENIENNGQDDDPQQFGWRVDPMVKPNLDAVPIEKPASLPKQTRK